MVGCEGTSVFAVVIDVTGRETMRCHRFNRIEICRGVIGRGALHACHNLGGWLWV